MGNSKMTLFDKAILNQDDIRKLIKFVKNPYMINQLVEKITQANEAYRSGNSIISDQEYDILIEELQEMDPHNPILNKVGHEIKDESRKSKLPIEMASMNKVKTIDEIFDWCRNKEISRSHNVVITPKYDGLSLCVNESTNNAFTRGDGEYGQKSDEHYKLIGNKLNLDSNPFEFTYGEVIMKKSTFLEKYSNDFANPRNLVAGLINSKEATTPLKDINYIKYGAVVDPKLNDFKTKSELLTQLNDGQDIKVPFKVTTINNLNQDDLQSLFDEWSKEFEIDGLIIELDSLKLQNELGRETSSNNPVWARAYKSSNFEQTAETEILGIEWNISKNGSLKPVAILNPIELGGVIVSRCTLNNARFVKDNEIGNGSKVKIVRSGMVIPKVVEVLKRVNFRLPQINGVEITWNDSGVDLITVNETDEQKLKRIESFFEILEAQNISTGIIKQLWNAGFTNIKEILELKKNDLKSIDNFGDRKSEIVFNSIKNSIKDVQLNKLQHATGIFKNMGSKKLKLLEHFTEKPSIEEVIKIDGIGYVLANEYVENYDNFFDFISDLPVTIKKETKSNSSFSGFVVCFTGIRLKNEEKIIENGGGEVTNSVSKNTTHLVCKDKKSTSTKILRARQLGITIMDTDEFLRFIS